MISSGDVLWAVRFSLVVSVYDERDGDSDDAHSAPPRVEDDRTTRQRFAAGVLAAQTLRGRHAQRRCVYQSVAPPGGGEEGSFPPMGVRKDR